MTCNIKKCDPSVDKSITFSLKTHDQKPYDFKRAYVIHPLAPFCVSSIGSFLKKKILFISLRNMGREGEREGEKQ